MSHSRTSTRSRPAPDQQLRLDASILAELADIPLLAGVSSAPAGRHAGEAARTWERAALQSLAARLSNAAAACLLARALATARLPRSVPVRRLALRLLDVIAAAAEDLDEAHELAYELSKLAQRRCIDCGGPVGRIPGRTRWEHLPDAGPAAGAVAPSRGHQPRPAREPLDRPAITGGRISPASRS
jgi:hypothetical protein